MNRRRFMKTSAGLLIPSFSGIIGCSKNTLGPENEELTSTSYYETNYSTGEGISNSDGVAEVVSKDNIYDIRFMTEDRKPIGGLEVSLHKNKKDDSKVFYVKDPEKRFMPNMCAFRGVGKRTSGILDVIMYAKEIFQTKNNKNVIVNKLDISGRIEESLPSWDPEKVDGVPGFVYMGDWSFNELKNMNGLLRDSSGVVTFIAPNPITAEAYGVLSTTGVVLEGIDLAIDGINKYSDFEINKDKKYPIYKPNLNASGISDLIVSLSDVRKNETVDIRELWPLQPGNWWVYSDDGDPYLDKYYCKILPELVRINNKETMVFEHKQMFKGKFIYEDYDYLRYFNFSEEGLFEIAQSFGRMEIFDPSIKISNMNIRNGDFFSTSFDLLQMGDTKDYNNYTEKDYYRLSGNPNPKEEYLWKKLDENVIVNGVPYGNCWKLTRGTIFAKNVGPIIYFGKLIDYKINA